MKGLPEERAVRLAEYMIKHNATVRDAATIFHLKKITKGSFSFFAFVNTSNS